MMTTLMWFNFFLCGFLREKVCVMNIRTKQNATYRNLGQLPYGKLQAEWPKALLSLSSFPQHFFLVPQQSIAYMGVMPWVLSLNWNKNVIIWHIDDIKPKLCLKMWTGEWSCTTEPVANLWTLFCFTHT